MATQPRIHLRQVEAGPMANYVYIIGDPATRKAAVVDPAWNIDGILDLVNRDGYEVGKMTVKFLHTPGHTPGSQCFLIDNNLISGDTLFIGSCGRVDLPGADPEQ